MKAKPKKLILLKRLKKSKIFIKNEIKNFAIIAVVEKKTLDKNIIDYNKEIIIYNVIF